MGPPLHPPLAAAYVQSHIDFLLQYYLLDNHSKGMHVLQLYFLSYEIIMCTYTMYIILCLPIP